MNRQSKRLLQRQGALGPDGSPSGASRDQVAAEAGRRRQAGPKEPIAARSVEYMREVRSELQRVAWPGRSEVANYTVVVFLAVVLLTAFIYGLDYGFAKGIIYLFR